MAKLTKAQQTERREAIEKLRSWIKPGDTVYTVLDHVSSSGMSRHIRVVVPYTRYRCQACGATGDAPRGPVTVTQCPRWAETKCPGVVAAEIDHLHPNHAVGLVLGLKQAKRGDGLVVGGCGMDMGFHLVYELSATLYGDGYACLGKGKCPSNYHMNHRDRVRCEGTRVHNPDGPDTRQMCYRLGWGHRTPEAELDTWPRLPAIDIGDGETIPGPYAAVLLSDDDDAPKVVCPTCKGVGDLPNPAGPERFDLIHTDGYALRHRWL